MTDTLATELAALQALVDRLGRDLERIQQNAALREQRGCATEYDVGVAQKAYEAAEAALKAEVRKRAKRPPLSQYGEPGSELRRLWVARERARERYQAIDHDYCSGGKLWIWNRPMGREEEDK